MRLHPLCRAATGLIVLLMLPNRTPAADWPGWRGPHRDGICAETGLLKRWPREGPKLLWKATGLGEGFSGPAIVGNLLYTMGNRSGEEWVMALDLRNRGKLVWATPIGIVRHKGGGYPGPRSTPTIDAGRLYTLGCAGDLVCLDAKDGHAIWKRDLARDFGGRAPQWGYAESVLIDGHWLVCTPGGRRATIVALRKSDGRPVWTSPVGDDAQYSSILKVSIGRVPQYVNFTKRGVISVRASDGKFLWRWNRPANGTANVTTPVWYGQTIFAASAYGTGGGAVWPRVTADGFQPQELYFTRDMKNHHGGLVLFEGCLYGANDPDRLVCLDYKTGRVKWSDPRPGKCSVLFADNMLFCRDENGPVSLVEATPEEFRLRGRFEQPDRSRRKAWPHPVIAGGRLFLRDQDVLLCYDVRPDD